MAAVLRARTIMRVRVHRARMLMLVFLLCVNSNAAAFEEVLFIPWGTGAGNVTNRLEFSGRYGPTDFDIIPTESHDLAAIQFVVLDREQQLLQLFDLTTHSFVSAVPIPAWSERFALRGSLIALWDGTRMHNGVLGDKLLQSDHGTYPFKTVQQLLWDGDRLLANDDTESSFLVALGTALISPHAVRQTAPCRPSCARAGPTSFSVTEPNGHQVHVTCGAQIGSVMYVGTIAC